MAPAVKPVSYEKPVVLDLRTLEPVSKPKKTWGSIPQVKPQPLNLHVKQTTPAKPKGTPTNSKPTPTNSKPTPTNSRAIPAKPKGTPAGPAAAIESGAYESG